MKATVSLAIGIGVLLLLAALLAPMDASAKIFVGLVGAVFAGAGYFNRR